MKYRAVKIGLAAIGLGFLGYSIYKFPYILVVLGCLEALDFYRSKYNPAEMYTFKFLEWVFKD